MLVDVEGFRGGRGADEEGYCGAVQSGVELAYHRYWSVREHEGSIDVRQDERLHKQKGGVLERRLDLGSGSSPGHACRKMTSHTE
jgi:hypothetical protein